MVLFRVKFCTKVCIFLLQQHCPEFAVETQMKNIWRPYYILNQNYKIPDVWYIYDLMK